MHHVVGFAATNPGLIRSIETDDAYPGVTSPQEALRLFPPFRDEDGLLFNAVDVNCPDCDAVFSSLYGQSPIVSDRAGY